MTDWRDDEAFVAWLTSANGFGHMPISETWQDTAALVYNGWRAALEKAAETADSVDPQGVYSPLAGDVREDAWGTQVEIVKAIRSLLQTPEEGDR